ncbi:hypothetical protein Pla52o_00380 [Novipirellula galeiformis]|uniref:DUF2141 domain-containing protein n=1 Tax=Novipirellula galeiformis TaxID=2528004 RepID=A0A5C6CT08_9BACT|nr:DUF2141 domain-containing protein [Novipirellula galeiformis]TWU26186.1 hypothetical protein Pla52o_00380 [Novipirellula galeiformis]
MQELDDAKLDDSLPNSQPESLWAQNHGNVLLVFLAGLIVAGSGMLLYRQSRSVAPGFPNARRIAELNSSEMRNVSSDMVLFKVAGATDDEGAIVLAIYDSEASFADLSQANWSQEITVSNGQASWTLPFVDLPEKFAVVAFHDKNGDREFNRNTSEQVGYSRLEPNDNEIIEPNFQQSLISRPPAGGETIQIQLRTNS